MALLPPTQHVQGWELRRVLLGPYIMMAGHDQDTCASCIVPAARCAAADHEALTWGSSASTR